MTIGELEKHEWTKGDDFIVYFGGHRVGYLCRWCQYRPAVRCGWCSGKD
jgi:hypothetical protein